MQVAHDQFRYTQDVLQVHGIDAAGRIIISSATAAPARCWSSSRRSCLPCRAWRILAHGSIIRHVNYAELRHPVADAGERSVKAWLETAPALSRFVINGVVPEDRI